MKHALLALTLISISTGAAARGHRGGHSHYSYHATNHYSAPAHHTTTVKRHSASIAHHAAKAAAGTAASTAVRRAMKPKPANQPRSSYTPQPLPPMPVTTHRSAVLV